MASKLKLGIIGMSEGNGHPYSWSAIFNGYNLKFMKDCPYPAIPGYLSKQKFPQNGLGHLASVTHVWAQTTKMSSHIASSCNIENITTSTHDMIGQVDAILLARDDAKNHYKMALPFLKAGLPIFIDKPLALSVAMAKKIISAQVYSNQIFTCSALRYSDELVLSKKEMDSLGKIYHVEGSIMKKWDTYSVHLLEPLFLHLPHRGKLNQVIHVYKKGIKSILIEWKNATAYLKVTGDLPVPLELIYFGESLSIKKTFSDPYDCFKKSLDMFIKVVKGKRKNIERKETLEIVDIIEKGR